MQEFTMTVVSLAFCDVAWYRDGCSADLVGEAEFFSRGELFRRGIYLHDQIHSLLPRDEVFVMLRHEKLGTRCSVQIGRASCRERGGWSVGGESVVEGEGVIM